MELCIDEALSFPLCFLELSVRAILFEFLGLLGVIGLKSVSM